MNISKLNLKSLKPVEILFRLENLFASDNLFESSKDIGLSLGYLIFLKNTDLKSCPAQKEIHYREQITASTYKLHTLDGKDIPHHARDFIKKFEQMKLLQLNRKKKITTKKVLDGTTGNLSKPMFDLSNSEVGSISYQTWMSLNPEKRKPPKKATKAEARICSAKPDLEGELLGKTVLN